MTNTLYIRDMSGCYAPADTQFIISEAKRRIAGKFRRGTTLTSPDAARDAIQLKLAEYDHEVFACWFLDCQHRLIQFAELSHGTIDSASVYPREVVKQALAYNAAAVIFCHNHPSGLAAPSDADKKLTDQLAQALALVQIRVLDHFVVGSDEAYSFAEHGLLR